MSVPTLPRVEIRPRRSRTEPGPQPIVPIPRGRRLAPVGLAVVLVAFAARGLDVAWQYSITSDETTHLTHCLHFWMTGDDLSMWELGTPRLPHLLNALPSYLALRQARLLPAGADPRAIEKVVLSG